MKHIQSSITIIVVSAADMSVLLTILINNQSFRIVLVNSFHFHFNSQKIRFL